jgi:hypothetical protein
MVKKAEVNYREGGVVFPVVFQMNVAVIHKKVMTDLSTTALV